MTVSIVNLICVRLRCFLANGIKLNLDNRIMVQHDEVKETEEKDLESGYSNSNTMNASELFRSTDPKKSNF